MYLALSVKPETLLGGGTVTRRKTRAVAIILALAGMPFVTTATCDPMSGTFDFYRNDDQCDGFLGDFLCDVGYYDDYDDDCWYGDCYDDCWYCF